MRFRRRLILLYVVFCCVMGVVWLRATQLQWIDGDVWAQAARKLRQRPERLDAMRGPIVSADGVVLAEDAPVFQLTVVAWDFQRRARARCSGCGAIYFQSGRRKLHFPRTCACRRQLIRRSGEDAYPRKVPKEESAQLERLPPADLRPLEKVLDIAPGSLAIRAKERVAEVERIIRELRDRMDREGDDTSFREKRLELRAQDLLRRPFVIIGNLPDAAAQLVLTNEDGTFRGFGVRSALRRNYPLGDFAPQLLGFTSQLGPEEYGPLREQHGDRVTFNTRIGRTGVERACNWQMHGEPGHRLMELDESGQFSITVEDRPPRPGKPVALSIHAKISRIAEQLLFSDPRRGPAGYVPQGQPSGAFVALDAYTGEVLIWSEAPRYDLNTELDDLYDKRLTEAKRDLDAGLWIPRHPLDKRMTIEEWRARLVQPAPVSMSRIAQLAVEPGSTFKPLIALGLLQSGLPLPFHSYHCHNSTRSPGCHACGSVDLVRAIEKSCNRYFAYSVRDSKYWPTYRTYLGGFIEEVGIGRAPTDEISEWSRGQWLWPYVDFTMKDMLGHAQAWLQEHGGDDAPTLELAALPGTPPSVGGDPARLGSRLAKVAAWVAKRTRARKLLVSATRVETIERDVVMEFGVRAAGARPWSALPGTDRTALPSALSGLPRHRVGIRGQLERGGMVWFRATMPRRVGRTDRSKPPVIRPDDGRNVAIGQGPVLVTPLQMARAIAVLANGGLLVDPHVVRAVGGRAVQRVPRRLRIDPGHIDTVRDGMYRVVNEEGTARKANWGQVPATVYGKTGTAQVGRTWQPFGETEDGGPWHHWFVGFAEAPGRRTIAFACVLHARAEAASGMTAAPATADILARWYQDPASRGGK